MQQGNFINVFLARHVSGTYTHHQEHQTLSCTIWFSEFLDEWWSWEPLRRSCVRCGWCRETTTSAPHGDQNPYERFGKETNMLHLTVIEPRFIGRLASGVVTSQTLTYGPSPNVHNLGELKIELGILYNMLKMLFYSAALQVFIPYFGFIDAVLWITKRKVGAYNQQVINAESKQCFPENTWLICGRVFTPGQRNNWGWGRKQLLITKPLILWVRCHGSGLDGKSVTYCIVLLPQLVRGTYSLKVDGITCHSLSPASNEVSLAWAEYRDT